jgi:hypothetical protein
MTGRSGAVLLRTRVRGPIRWALQTWQSFSPAFYSSPFAVRLSHKTPARRRRFDSVVELARGRKHSFDRIIADCQATKPPSGFPAPPLGVEYLSLCSPNYTTQFLTGAISDTSMLKTLLGLRESLNNVGGIIAFLSTQIADYIRANSSKAEGARQLDVSDIIFFLRILMTLIFQK